MPGWCEVDDVEKHLKGVQGRNFNADDVSEKIVEARDVIITRLAEKFPQERYDAWDADLSAVPPMIKQVNAKLAAALTLEAFAENNSIADSSSKAGGFYRFCMDQIKAIKAGTLSIPAGVDDNTPVVPSSGSVASSKTAADRIFTRDTMENI